MPIYSKREDWGGFEISHALYTWIRSNLPQGDTILELGSGWGSGQLAKRWNVWSVEHNEKWFKKYNKQSVLIPIKDGWYNSDQLKDFLNTTSYDLLLIDGPYPQKRRGFVKHFHLFDHSVPIVFDDIKRDDGRKIMKEISDILQRPAVSHGTAFGTITGDR